MIHLDGQVEDSKGESDWYHLIFIDNNAIMLLNQYFKDRARLATIRIHHIHQSYKFFT